MSYEHTIINVRDLCKRYEIYNTPRDRLKQLILPRLYHVKNSLTANNQHQTTPNYFREFWALRNVSFQVQRGGTLGIIGRNGSGKSTLLQILAGTLTQTSGQVSVSGRIAALLELGSGFNPQFSGRDNVFLNGRILGLSKKEIENRYEQIVDFADIGEFINQPVKTYSSGMFVRLAFAVQAHIDASVVIIDEALAVGDVFFRQKCYARLEQLRNSGAAIILVSHSMTDIEQYCERAILLDHGTVKFIGSSSEAAKHYYLLHQTKPQIARKPTPRQSAQDFSQAPHYHRPPREAYIDISHKSQVSNGQARCTGVALCNESGQPCNCFHQGDMALFYYEFEITEHIGVPLCGIVLKNDRGIIVHGKNSWQYGGDVPESLDKGSKILCLQKIRLDLEQGDYLFEVGLASISNDTWAHRQNISHEETATQHLRICHVPDVSSFSVGLATINNTQVLLHHGIANLPGDIKIAVE